MEIQKRAEDSDENIIRVNETKCRCCCHGGKSHLDTSSQKVKPSIKALKKLKKFNKELQTQANISRRNLLCLPFLTMKRNLFLSTLLTRKKSK